MAVTPRRAARNDFRAGQKTYLAHARGNRHFLPPLGVFTPRVPAFPRFFI